MSHPAPEPAPASQDPRIGMVLQERYRILKKLGDGGMGAVYEGEHILIKRRVAIKMLHAQFAQNPEIVARFQREAEAATSIGHANIVEVTDMGSFPDGTAYMVLEYLEGEDWSHDIEKNGAQPLGKVVHIISQVCDALTAAHAKGIVHRDLKPENIFIIERGGDPYFAKVLDFGISKIQDAKGGENRSLTQTGTALGTPYYMAPEQCQGKKDIDLRADIYALGVIIFQALTGQYPFDDESYPMLVLKICTEPPPPLTHYRPDVPIQVQEIVNRMLAKDADYRFSSCAEVKAALEPFRGVNDAPVVSDAPSTSSIGSSVLGGPPAQTPTGTAYLNATSAPGAVTPWPEQPPKRSLLLPALVGLGLLVVAGGAVGAALAFGAFSRVDDRPPPIASHEGAAVPDEAEVDEGAEASPAEGEEAAGVAAAEGDDTPAVRQQVRVATEPADAALTFDGSPVPNPFETEVPPGTYHLVATAEGYEAAERDIQVTERFPIRTTLTLRREGGGRADRGDRGGRSGRSEPVAAPTPQPLAPQPAQPPPPRREGFGAVGGSRPSRGGTKIMGSGDLF